ncbi:MAG: hypothetical protein NC489_30540 [Ruminococcus flavefaciens]|nr:hypothetical protein [Ruminococcus flavefaciens]
MLKYIYKFIALLFVFGISIFFFWNSIPVVSVGTTTATSLQASTFPLVYIQLGKYTVNTLHGYSSEINSSKIRECITPLDADKTFQINIDENKTRIKKVSYELRDIANNKVIEENTLTAFDTKGNYKIVKVKLTEAIDTSTEYGMMITLTTNLSKRIHFYTRIKYYETDFFLKEKIDFVKKFHNATFDKGKSLNIANYIETNNSDDTTLSDVNINSSYKLITWGKLKPKIITDIVPTIKEINVETAAIRHEYYVQADTASGTEFYQIKEFYRVRYSGNRMYLLGFKRTMEATFNPDLISLKKNELKIGISNIKDLEISTSKDQQQFAFVRNGSLWYYNLKNNQLFRVFSFEKDNKDYLHDCYDQHDIKILNFTEKGTVSFAVYGYMNCGDYEGRVGILLYDYDPADNQITERVYIPLTTTYEQLRHDFGEFCYVNDKNIFYFSLNDVVYAYNISSKKYEILTKNAAKDNFVMLKEAKSFIWSDASKNGYAHTITVLDLEQSEKMTVSAPKNQCISILGTIDTNIVYGYIRNSDIYEDTTGEIIQPIYRLIISDCQGNILKKYQNKRIYVSGATFENNIIRLTRLKKVGGHFKKASDDSIQNQENKVSRSIDLTTRVTEKALTENYISLPAGYVLERKPDIKSTDYVMVTENTTLHLQDNTPSVPRYYIYAYGTITDCLTDAAEAILTADEKMGMVMDSDSHIVWERGGKFLSKELSGISYADSDSSIKACTQMLLQGAQITTTVSKLKGKSIVSMLDKHLEQPVSLTGCSLDEILYFVSSGKPVIGMLSDNHAVLIIAYTSSTVSWMDPASKTKTTMSLLRADHLFSEEGNNFVSYIAY